MIAAYIQTLLNVGRSLFGGIRIMLQTLQSEFHAVKINNLGDKFYNKIIGPYPYSTLHPDFSLQNIHHMMKMLAQSRKSIEVQCVRLNKPKLLFEVVIDQKRSCFQKIRHPIDEHIHKFAISSGYRLLISKITSTITLTPKRPTQPCANHTPIMRE